MKIISLGLPLEQFCLAFFCVSIISEPFRSSRLIGFLRPMFSCSKAFILSFCDTPQRKTHTDQSGSCAHGWPRVEQHHEIVEGSSQKEMRNPLLRKGFCAGKRQQRSNYNNRNRRRLV